MLFSNTVNKRLVNLPRLLFLIIVLTCHSSFAQDKGTIRGVVKESTTLESLPFGNVFIKELNIGASANNRGYFIIPSVPANKNYTIVISYVGYKTQQLNILVKPDIITELEILLVPSNIQFDAIETIEYLIKDEKIPDLGKTVITPKELETLPKGVELMEHAEEVVVTVATPKAEKVEEVVAPVDLTQIEVEKKGKKEEEGIPVEEVTKS